MVVLKTRKGKFYRLGTRKKSFQNIILESRANIVTIDKMFEKKKAFFRPVSTTQFTTQNVLNATERLNVNQKNVLAKKKCSM